METLQREEASKLWEKYWDEMSQEWFKVEVLQDYSGEDAGPSLEAWLKGEEDKAIEILRASAEKSEWAKTCQVKPDVKKIRIHVVEEPYTPYVEWEIEAYKIINVPECGENVFLASSSKVSHLNIPGGDFMIFDGTRVVKNSYDNTGCMESADFYEKGEDISMFLELKEELLKIAEPLK